MNKRINSHPRPINSSYYDDDYHWYPHWHSHWHPHWNPYYWHHWYPHYDNWIDDDDYEDYDDYEYQHHNEWNENNNNKDARNIYRKQHRIPIRPKKRPPPPIFTPRRG